MSHSPGHGMTWENGRMSESDVETVVREIDGELRTVTRADWEARIAQFAIEQHTLAGKGTMPREWSPNVPPQPSGVTVVADCEANVWVWNGSRFRWGLFQLRWDELFVKRAPLTSLPDRRTCPDCGVRHEWDEPHECAVLAGTEDGDA